jgi:hypothetical protein
MPEHENLELFGPVTPSEERDRLKQPTNDGVQQRYMQRRLQQTGTPTLPRHHPPHRG